MLTINVNFSFSNCAVTNIKPFQMKINVLSSVVVFRNGCHLPFRLAM